MTPQWLKKDAKTKVSKKLKKAFKNAQKVFKTTQKAFKKA